MYFSPSFCLSCFSYLVLYIYLYTLLKYIGRHTNQLRPGEACSTVRVVKAWLMVGSIVCAVLPLSSITLDRDGRAAVDHRQQMLVQRWILTIYLWSSFFLISHIYRWFFLMNLNEPAQSQSSIKVLESVCNFIPPFALLEPGWKFSKTTVAQMLQHIRKFSHSLNIRTASLCSITKLYFPSKSATNCDFPLLKAFWIAELRSAIPGATNVID